MFGLTFEKLIIIGVVAAFVIGPERLPHYASVLAKFVRQLRDFANGAKTRMKEEMGPDFDEVEWKKLDPRQYDPRRIIRDALLEDPAEVKPSAPIATGSGWNTAAPAGISLDKAPGSASADSGEGSSASEGAPSHISAAAPLAGGSEGVTLSRPEPAYLQRKKRLEAAAAASGTDGAIAPVRAPHDSEST